MKKSWIIIIVVLIIIAGFGYAARHTIKAMFGSTPPTPQPTEAMMKEQPSPTTSAMAPSDNIYQTKTDATKGQYLSDFQGMTLYIFDKDTTGISNCYNGCAKVWPPYTSGAIAQSQFPSHISVITRTDGTKQFAWDGKPLYYYASDAKAGVITGDGVGGVWHLVKP